MGLVTISAKDDRGSVPTSDGNDLLVYNAGSEKMEKEPWQDVYNALLDSHWTEGIVLAAWGFVEGGTVAEAAGVCNIAASKAGVGWGSKGIISPYVFGDGSWEKEFDNVQRIVGVKAQFYLMLFIDNAHFVMVYRNHQAAPNNKLSFYQAGVGDIGSIATAVTNFKVKITRSGNTIEGFYDLLLGGGWVSFGSINWAMGSNAAIIIQNNANGINPTCSADSDNLIVSGTGYFWDTIPTMPYNAAVVDDAAQSIIGAKFDFSTLLSPNEGTGITHDLSVNGGSSYLYTGQTLAQMQAKPDTKILAGGVKWRTNHGNGSSQSDFEKITFDAIFVKGPPPGMHHDSKLGYTYGLKHGSRMGA